MIYGLEGITCLKESRFLRQLGCRACGQSASEPLDAVFRIPTRALSSTVGYVRAFGGGLLDELLDELGDGGEDACAAQEGLDDEALAIVAAVEPLVLQQPSQVALHRPAPLAQTGAMRLATRVDAGLGAAAAAE